MKKNSKKSTNKPRERPLRPSPGGLYQTDGKNIYMTPELAKNVKEIFQELLEKFPELKKKARGEK